jgi:hypothetical protein
MDLSTVGVHGAAHGLAIHRHRQQHLSGVLSRGLSGSAGKAAARRACSPSQTPITASTAGASTPVTTRHSVVFDGASGSGAA